MTGRPCCRSPARSAHTPGSGTPYSSGNTQREQGISKDGNRRLRAAMVELAWMWLPYQPSCALSVRRTRPGVSRRLLIGHFSALMPSANRLRPDAEGLWERYDRLSPGPKTVLRLKSLVFLSTNKSAFLDCLIRSGLRTPEGRAWASAATNIALEA